MLFICAMCVVGLYDANNKELDNMTVTFETTDTCFCYGYCGCAVSAFSVYIIYNMT